MEQQDALTAAIKATEPGKFETDMVKGIRNNFMSIQVSVSQWDGRVTDKELAKLVESAGIQSAKQSKVNTTFSVYGRAQSDFDEVRSAYTQVREYMYKETHCFAESTEKQKKGDRLVGVLKASKLTSDLQGMAKDAEALLENFIANYDQHLQCSKIALGLDVFNRLSNQTDKLGRHRIPTANELRTRFDLTVHTPQPLAIHTMDDVRTLMGSTGSPDIGFAAQVAEASFAKIKGQIQSAQDEAFKEAKEALDAVNRQLSKAPTQDKHGREMPARLHDALLVNTKKAAEKLRELAPTMGSPSDLEAVLQEVESKVANVSSAAQWHNSNHRKDEANQASERLAKQLDAIQERNHQALAVQGDGFEVEDFEEY